MKNLASISAPVFRLFRNGLDRFGAGGWTVFLLLISLVAGFAGHLIFGENPWDRGVPEKLEAEERLSIRDTIVCGLWAASLINLILGIGLLGLAKFWGRKVEARVPVDAPSRPALAISGRVFWIVVLLAVAFGAWTRAPRLSHSFWNDEEQAFRKFTWGQHVIVEKDGKQTVKFQSNGWDRALFYSINGNNHVVHTIAAKASHQIWRAFAKPDRETFSESVIRIEPFLSGLLTIILIGVWLRSLGYSLAGAASPWLLALHPWHLRYSVEARGYSALLLFVILAFLFLGFALKRNRWRWWLAYGAAQSLYLLCFAGAAYLAMAMNLIVLGTLIWRRDGAGFWRWMVACVLGAMIFLQMMVAPALRFMNWAESPDVLPFAMDFAFFRDFWTHLTVGVPWASGAPELHRYTSFRDLAAQSVFMAVGIKIVLPLLLISGVGLSMWKDCDLRRFFAVLIFAAALIWIHNIASDLVFFVWYALYILIGFIVALAVLPEMAAGLLKHDRSESGRFPIPVIASVLIVTGFAWLSHEPRSLLSKFDRHPMRQAVEFVRGEAPALGLEQADLITASVGSGANQMQTYDPWLHWLKSEDDLDAVIAEARDTRKPLVVYCCSPRQVKRELGGLFEKLEDDSLFDVEAPEFLKGLEEYWSYRIYRLKKRPETNG